MMDICSPGGRIRIRSVPEAREQTEFEMIVGVDQPRQEQIAGEIEFGRWFRFSIERKHPATGDADVESLTTHRVARNPRAREPNYFRHIVARTAGVDRTRSNKSFFPALSKIARSGSPKQTSVRHSGTRPARCAQSSRAAIEWLKC